MKVSGVRALKLIILNNDTQSLFRKCCDQLHRQVYITGGGSNPSYHGRGFQTLINPPCQCHCLWLYFCSHGTGNETHVFVLLKKLNKIFLLLSCIVHWFNKINLKCYCCIETVFIIWWVSVSVGLKKFPIFLAWLEILKWQEI